MCSFALCPPEVKPRTCDRAGCEIAIVSHPKWRTRSADRRFCSAHCRVTAWRARHRRQTWRDHRPIDRRVREEARQALARLAAEPDPAWLVARREAKGEQVWRQQQEREARWARAQVRAVHPEAQLMPRPRPPLRLVPRRPARRPGRRGPRPLPLPSQMQLWVEEEEPNAIDVRCVRAFLRRLDGHPERQVMEFWSDYLRLSNALLDGQSGTPLTPSSYRRYAQAWRRYREWCGEAA